nr:MAG TPA: hypothetical protein [Caudoviricetes sp.]DAT57466.1 MAG TPA: hypothetical protein [Caudoviricetes sp.]
MRYKPLVEYAHQILVIHRYSSLYQQKLLISQNL